VSLTRPKPASRDAPDAECRLRLLSTLTAEQITCVGTGRFSSLSRRAAGPPEQMAPEDCLRRALHIVAEHHSPSMALAWFVAASGKDEAPIDVLVRGGCAEVLARARAVR
jgi:hypothetical protein